MTQYNHLNAKLSNSQLNELNSAIKNKTEVVLKLPSNMIGNDETNFPHKLLLTNRQVVNLRKAFAKNHQIISNYQKLKSSKMIQSGGFLCRLPRPFLKNKITANKKCS